ncbi:hypothetical protein [Rhodosalinus sp.]|uniref:hypothetical protein n=1 Tax=Rhodosalinus sp. TaxID=2047741 RepID=UPI00397BF540
MLAATGQREVTRAWRHEARAVQLGIPEAAQRLRARLMVLSPHGRADLAQLPIASVTEALLHNSPPACCRSRRTAGVGRQSFRARPASGHPPAPSSRLQATRPLRPAAHGPAKRRPAITAAGSRCA